MAGYAYDPLPKLSATALNKAPIEVVSRLTGILTVEFVGAAEPLTYRVLVNAAVQTPAICFQVPTVRELLSMDITPTLFLSVSALVWLKVAVDKREKKLEVVELPIARCV